MSLLTTNGLSLQSSLGARDSRAYARDMTDNLEDSALMLRYQEGDVNAFEILYRRHNDSLYRYLLRLSLNHATAEDLYQEAWGKIINARQNYRPTARFSTYLFRVAHNCFIDYVRRNKRHTAEIDIDPDLSEALEDAPEYVAEKKLFRERLNRCLANLPEEQRDVFLLHQEGGFSIDDIAKITGVNRETTKSRLRYAMRKLKTELADSNKGQV